MTTHLQDADCTVDPETNSCETCGVLHGDPCSECNGRGFHALGCTAIDGPSSNVLPGRFGDARAWECACSPPVRVEVGDDDFDATCKRCGQRFPLCVAHVMRRQRDAQAVVDDLDQQANAAREVVHERFNEWQGMRREMESA